MQEKKFKCQYCEKSFTKKHNRDNHEKLYCKSNPISIKQKEDEQIKIDEILTAEEEVIEVIKPKYTENELYILKIFKQFNYKNIEVKNDIRIKLEKIYLIDYNKKVSCDCCGEYLNMYLFFNKKKIEILNR